MLHLFHVVTTALLLPASRLSPHTPSAHRRQSPSRTVVLMAEASGVVDGLRESLAAVRLASPLSPNDRAQVRRLCDQIAKAASEPVQATPSAAAAQDIAWVPSAPMDKSAVGGALERLFAYYDADKDGLITLDDMLRGGESIYDRAASTEWATRQARAGARRLRRIFSRGGSDGRISQERFVSLLQLEFDRRIERGLSIARAVAEIEANLSLIHI